MNIASFQPCSLNEYPGKISAIVFTQGCNFKCYFCHNPELQCFSLGYLKEVISSNVALEKIKKLGKKINGVVITGGEPLVQGDLVFFVEEINKLGLPVKLNTNGSVFNVLKRLVSKRLVDYINMDIKAPLKKYPKVTGVNIASFESYKYWNPEEIQKSIGLIKDSGIDYMFSIVKHSSISKNDVHAMIKWLGSKNVEVRTKI